MMRPNFSGTWQFDPVASTLQIAIPDSVALIIEHQDPLFHLERTLAFGGRSDTFGIDLMKMEICTNFEHFPANPQ